jgi:hypothetical protein
MFQMRLALVAALAVNLFAVPACAPRPRPAITPAPTSATPSPVPPEAAAAADEISRLQAEIVELRLERDRAVAALRAARVAAQPNFTPTPHPVRAVASPAPATRTFTTLSTQP